MDMVNVPVDTQARAQNPDLIGPRSSRSSYSSSQMLQQRNCLLAFVPYSSCCQLKPSSGQVSSRKSLVTRLSKDIVETYRACNPDFKYSEKLKLKRYLTTPSIGLLNDGYNNVNSDLIVSVKVRAYRAQ